MRGNILYRLIYFRVLQTAQFYLFWCLFWSTPSTLKIAKSSPPQIKLQVYSVTNLTGVLVKKDNSCYVNSLANSVSGANRPAIIVLQMYFLKSLAFILIWNFSTLLFRDEVKMKRKNKKKQQYIHMKQTVLSALADRIAQLKKITTLFFNHSIC